MYKLGGKLRNALFRKFSRFHRNGTQARRKSKAAHFLISDTAPIKKAALMENPSIIRIALKTSNVNILKKFLNRLRQAKRAAEGGRNAAPDAKRTAVGVAAAEVARFFLQNIKIFLHFINKQCISFIFLFP